MIAITGASGFIGSYIADKLPFPQKRMTRNIHSCCQHSNTKCNWIQGDLQNNDDIKNFVQSSPILIHLACTSNPRTSNLNIINDIEHNLLSTIQLFETFASNNPNGHIIFSSTGGNMYDASIQNVVRTENDIPCPRSSYAINKLAIEHYLRQICEMKGMKGTILRISNPYGVLLSTKRVQGLIGVAFSKALIGEELPIIDSLETVRDYIHLKDVARAFELVLQSPPSIGECRLFNLSSGCGFSNASILDIIEKTTQIKIKKNYSLKELPIPTWSVISSIKIQQALGWRPIISLPQGIEEIWKNKLNSQLNLNSHSYASSH